MQDLNIQFMAFENDCRITQRFNIALQGLDTILGETNWFAFRIVFKIPSDLNWACLSNYNNFYVGMYVI